MSAIVPTNPQTPCPHPLLPAQQRAWQALQEQRFFKLIGGGSLTDLPLLKTLASVYGQVGIDCIDIAPDLSAIDEVQQVLQVLPQPPMLMISLPLDPDPHFRKIDLLAEDCILCGACLPVCPTQAIGLQESNRLIIEQPLCYGCGRCVPTCPTDALVLHPFLPTEQIQDVLAHPAVEAVELHTQHADPLMLLAFLAQYGPLLTNKIVAYCFRPDQARPEFWLESIEILNAQLPLPILLQIDGAPMSGSSDPKASLPALEAAYHTYPLLENRFGADHCPPITISGGINRQTADYLTQADYSRIAGVGIGTFARQWITTPDASLPEEYADRHSDPSPDRRADLATRRAQALVHAFKNRSK